MDTDTVNVIKKMKSIVKGRHWWILDDDERNWGGVGYYAEHLARHYRGSLKNRTYGFRKKNFVPYRSRRKKGVEYLPF